MVNNYVDLYITFFIYTPIFLTKKMGVPPFFNF